MMNMFKTAAAAAVVMALPFAASAATANLPSVAVMLVPDAYSESYTVLAGDEGVVFNFNVVEDLRIPQFSLSSSAPSGGSNTTMYEITQPATGPSSFGILNLATVGADIVPGAQYAAGDTFQVIFTETTPDPISYTVSFSTAAVPVPAAGLLLLTAVGGAAALRRRKKA
jgi:hypothetical protein